MFVFNFRDFSESAKKKSFAGKISNVKVLVSINISHASITTYLRRIPLAVIEIFEPEIPHKKQNRPMGCCRFLLKNDRLRVSS